MKIDSLIRLLAGTVTLTGTALAYFWAGALVAGALVIARGPGV